MHVNRTVQIYYKNNRKNESRNSSKKNRSFRFFFCHFFLRSILLLQHLSRRFQLFFFNHFDQFSRVVLDWQLSISPTCSSLLGWEAIHSFTHTLALQHHSSGYSFTAAKARTASLGRNQNFVRSSCVLRQQQASWRFSLRSSRPKIFSVRTTAVRFTVVHYFLFPI